MTKRGPRVNQANTFEATFFRKTWQGVVAPAFEAGIFGASADARLKGGRYTV
jgi:hypothetical protein